MKKSPLGRRPPISSTSRGGRSFVRNYSSNRQDCLHGNLRPSTRNNSSACRRGCQGLRRQRVRYRLLRRREDRALQVCNPSARRPAVRQGCRPSHGAATSSPSAGTGVLRPGLSHHHLLVARQWHHRRVPPRLHHRLSGRPQDRPKAGALTDVVQPLLKGKRLMVGIDDTPTARYGWHVEGAGIHRGPPRSLSRSLCGRSSGFFLNLFSAG
jgi:hypothetical protein